MIQGRTARVSDSAWEAVVSRAAQVSCSARPS